jgi:hypothetical protein
MELVAIEYRRRSQLTQDLLGTCLNFHSVTGFRSFQGSYPSYVFAAVFLAMPSYAVASAPLVKGPNWPRGG